MTLTGAATVAGVIGWPVHHSRSPQIHNHWLARYGLDGAYVPLAVAPEDLGWAVGGLSALGLAGANVTVPHKEKAVGYCNHLDEVAARLQAVNTLVVHGDGSLEGRNSDGYGFYAHLCQDVPGWDPSAGPAVVLGAGGAARAVVAALVDAGAPEIRLVNRTRTRAEALAKALGGGRTRIIDWSKRGQALAGANLLVNTTSLGMAGSEGLDLPLDGLPDGAPVNDLVYNPLQTDLLAAAEQRGNPAVDGLGMLLHQARPGFAAWFGRDPVVDQELRDIALGRG